jgi:hypothetical protein
LLSEPILESGKQAEATFQRALVATIHAARNSVNLPFVVIERFGLDIAVLIGNKDQLRIKMLELKAFVGGRPGGVGFGDSQGRGPQVDLLWDGQKNQPRSPQELELLDHSVRWVLAFGLKPIGTPRYAMFTCKEAQKAAMGGVHPGKQNNLRITEFEKGLLTWNALCDRIQNFVFN